MSENDIRGDEDAFVREAVRRVLDGDTEAFAAIVNAHQRLIAADLSRRLPPQDVQEVAQDTFIRAFRALPSYRGEAPLRIWILRIARHAAMDFWRKRYRRRDRLFSDLDDATLLHVEAVRQEEIAGRQTDRDAQASAREWLEAALRRLSPDDRAVITLVELEERSMEDAARRLGCGLSAVKVRAFRARRRLKTILEDIRPGKEEQP
ncbi:MAG: sigma-70 family RNA polymerase sigma factor [Opitutae bacterium]|nr:sigma-70 family RNA polymerase sigma factor [Opitutae bacterium]